METQINRMQPPTWRWLKVNQDTVNIDVYEEKGKVQTQIEGTSVAELITKEEIQLAESSFSKMDVGINEEWFSTFFKNQNTGYIFRNQGRESSHQIAYRALDGKINDYHYIEANENEQLTVQIRYQEGKMQNSITRILAKKDSFIRLVKVHESKDCEQSVDVVTVKALEGAKVEVISVDLFGNHLATNYVMDLEEDKSEGSIETVYLAGETQHYDFSYRMNHQGKKVKSEILLNGALKDRAQKIFRGTLDFQKGCAGAKGDENENVSLLSPEVVSKAVPILLCGEVDVEGNHAASAGQLDEDALFYIMSRGVSIENAREMLLYAKLSPTLDKIVDETVKESAMERINELLHGKEV